MFDFNRITLFCLEKRLSKQKMTIFSKHFGGHGLFGSPRATPVLLGNIQQPWTVVRPYGNSQFFLSPMERRRQPGPGPHEFRPGPLTAGQTCSRKVPAVTKSALLHNATKPPGSCSQRSGETLEISQGRLTAFLPSCRWIRWEIATYRHIKYWEGMAGFLLEPAIIFQSNIYQNTDAG